jgi:hypothetical protein
MSTDGLAIIHLDGVGSDVLQRAVDAGKMPFVRELLNDGYRTDPYRPGLPSTTPYCQAGILYGDNRNIPGFRWYDKQAGIPIKFGVASSFKQVAHRYFQGLEGLVSGGAAIAACYPGGADKTFGLAFKERQHGIGSDKATRVVGRFLLQPQHLAEIAWHAVSATTASAAEYIDQRLQRRHPAVAYAAADVLEEIFLHDLTRYAIQLAMKDGLPVIYTGFYAYDEAAHGFGPEDAFSHQMLHRIDRTLRSIFQTREKVRAHGRSYEVIILSDHGQTRTRSFESVEGRAFGAVLSQWLPRLQVEDLKGKQFGPAGNALDGHLVLAASGGLAHLYLKELRGRLSRDQIEQAMPGLLGRLAAHPQVHFVMVRGRDGEDLIVTADGELRLDEATQLLAAFDDPDVLIRQLRKLNSFEAAGDLIVVARWNGVEQINFEKQVGGHGSIGGEQNHPFVLARSTLNVNVTGMVDASELYGRLQGLLPPA